jgi:hypothetical protein
MRGSAEPIEGRPVLLPSSLEEYQGWRDVRHLAFRYDKLYTVIEIEKLP